MRKRIFPVFAAAVLLTGCADAVPDVPESSEPPVSTAAPAPAPAEAVTMMVEYPYYGTIGSLEEDADAVIRCTVGEKTFSSRGGSPYTSIRLNVTAVYKGKCKVGSVIEMTQLGDNESPAPTALAEPYLALDADTEYVLFLAQSYGEYRLPTPEQAAYIWAEGDAPLKPAADERFALEVTPAYLESLK